MLNAKKSLDKLQAEQKISQLQNHIQLIIDKSKDHDLAHNCEYEGYKNEDF